MPIISLSYHSANWVKKIQFNRLTRPLLVAGLCVSSAISAMADTHSHLPTTPCDIRLIFSSDERGMPLQALAQELVQRRVHVSRAVPGAPAEAGNLAALFLCPLQR